MYKFVPVKQAKINDEIKRVKLLEQENSQISGDAICEIAEMVADQEEAILELAEIVGGIVDG